MRSGSIIMKAHSRAGFGYSIFGQWYDTAGVPNGPEFQVNSSPSGSDYGASVSVDGAGRFVVVWATRDYGEAPGILGQRFASDVIFRNGFETGLRPVLRP